MPCAVFLGMRFLLFFFLLDPLLLISQEYLSYKVEPGENPNVVLPVSARYSYNEFKPGAVLMSTGVTSRAQLNYNHLYGQMQFLKTGDTLYVSNVDDVKYVAVGTDTFYYQKYWLRQIACSGKIRLAEHKMLDYANNEKMGPYGGKSPGAVERVQSIDVVGAIDKNYIAREVLIFVERNSYYFSDRFGRYVPANKKNILDVFGKSTPGLEKYLSDAKPVYTRREDMLALLDQLKSQ